MDLKSLISNMGSMSGGGVLNTLKGFLNSNTQDRQGINQQNSPDAIAELTLLVEVLYNLLLSKGIITSDEFKAKFEELDMQDGVKDGKLRK